MFGIYILSMLSMMFIFAGNIASYGGMFQSSSTLTVITLWAMFYLAYIAINCFALSYGFKEYGKKHKLSRYLPLLLTALIYNVALTYAFHLYKPENVTMHSVTHAFFLLSNNAYWLFTAFTGMFLLSPIVDYMVEHISRETAIKAVWIIGLLGFYGLFSAGELKDPLLFKSGRGIIWFTCLYFIGATVRKHELYKVNVSKTALIGLCSFVLNGFLMLSLDKFIGNTFDDYFLSALSPLLLVTSICLLYVFANMNSKQEKIVQFIDESTLCTYLLASHSLFLGYVLLNQFTTLAGMPFYLLALMVIMIALSLYLVALIIDLIRRGIFKVLRLEKLALWIETLFGKLLNKLSA